MSSWDEIYRSLREQFVREAFPRLAIIDGLVESLERKEGVSTAVADLRFQFHKLAGAGGSYGFAAVSEISLVAERLCRATSEDSGEQTPVEVEALRQHARALRAAFDDAARELSLTLEG